MKRILLSYLFDLSGHHRACLALRRAFVLASSSDIHVEILSPLKRLYPNATPRVERIYHQLLRHAPQVWGAIYDRGFVRRTLGAWGVSWLESRADRLGPLIDEYRPDGMVCTQAIPCLFAARYKARHRKSFRLFAVLTDHHPHAYWANPEVDAYFVPSRYAADLLENYGVDAGRIHECGIPVDPELVPANLESKRRLRQALGLPEKLPHVLVMGGGSGHIPARALLREIAGIQAEIQVSVMTGKNGGLFRELIALEASYPKALKIFPYVDRPEDIMRSADVLVTKGGGLTTAEALVLGLPTVILRVLPGQEDFNARALSREKGVQVADTFREVRDAITGILERAGGPHSASVSAASPSAIDIAGRVLGAL